MIGKASSARATTRTPATITTKPTLHPWGDHDAFGRSRTAAQHIRDHAFDIMPTLLRLCGLRTPQTVEGRDWSPEIRGEQLVAENDAAFLNMPVPHTELQFNDILPLPRRAHHAPHLPTCPRRVLAPSGRQDRSLPNEQPHQCTRAR